MTLADKLVQEYTGLDMPELEELNIVDFRLFLRDAVIYNCLKTQAGKEYLERCWILEQTKPDRQALRGRFGGKPEAVAR